MNTKKTHFNDSWRLEFEWVTASQKSTFEAVCKLCKTSFSLSNMGKQALTSHMKGSKHQTIAGLRGSLDAFFPSDNQKNPSVSPVISLPTTNSAEPFIFLSSNEQTRVAAPTSTLQALSNKSSGVEVKKFVVNETVTKAEILKCLNCVLKHQSFSSVGADVSIYPLMFPDSDIAKKMQLQRAKVGYSIVYGLGPFFHNMLCNEIKSTKFITVGFDESLNKIAQKGQMDISVKFWSTIEREVVTKFFTSVFLRDCKAEDLLKAFVSGLEGVDLNTLLNVSMDGPSVNFKFFRILETYRKEQNPNAKIILFIGSCGIHVVNNAFKVGMKATGWNLIGLFKCSYYLFKDAPVRKGLFMEYTNCAQFPLKYCSVRWLENEPVTVRMIELLPHLKIYVKKAEEKKTAPSCQSFLILNLMLQDALLEAKLCFFLNKSKDFQRFLTYFQSDDPLAPFLYEQLTSLVQDLMSACVKPSVLKEFGVSKIDLSEKSNLLLPKEMPLTISVKGALRDVRDKLSNEDALKFREDCSCANITICEKIMDKSPLQYRLTRGISFLDPSVSKVAKKRDIRFKVAIKEMSDAGWITRYKADSLLKDFSNVCTFPEFPKMLNSFTPKKDPLNPKNHRLDHFWTTTLRSYAESTGHKLDELCEFFQMIFIISHGSAALGRGFSVNKEMVVENLREESLVALRQVYDVIKNEDLKQFIISKSMIMYFKNAHSSYKQALKERNTLALNQAKSVSDQALRRKKRESDIKQLVAIKRQRMASVEELDKEIEALKSQM